MALFTEFLVDDDPNPLIVCFYSTFRYRLADGSTLGIEEEAAWCGQCRSFGVAEVIPSLDELYRRRRELQVPTKLHYIVYGTDDRIAAARDALRARIRWRETRESPARCLTCGSTEIGPIRFGEDGSCVVDGRRLVDAGGGFAAAEGWVADFTPEGVAIPAGH